MSPRRRWTAAIAGAAAAGVFGVSMVGAQTGGSYGITWFAIPGGGGTSSGGSYQLSGAIGQPIADSSTGGTYTVQAGFFGGSSQRFRLFMAGVASKVQQ